VNPGTHYIRVRLYYPGITRTVREARESHVERPWIDRGPNQ